MTNNKISKLKNIIHLYTNTETMSNNKQQTAVEWFSVRRDVLEIEVRLGKLSPIEYAEELTKAEQQAKEMEKEQHATTWDKSMDNLDARGGNIVRAWVDFDEYYNETYGGGEQ
jgi:hypothetical protein